MAIDTAAKRKSTVGVGLHWLRMGVIADGANLSAPQRLHVQALYAGIAADAPPVGGTNKSMLPLMGAGSLLLSFGLRGTA